MARRAAETASFAARQAAAAVAKAEAASKAAAEARAAARRAAAEELAAAESAVLDNRSVLSVGGGTSLSMREFEVRAPGIVMKGELLAWESRLPKRN
jgi:hypothetical protein